MILSPKFMIYPTCLEVGDITVTDPTAISNSFNDYFTSIADEILKKRKYNGTKSFKDFLTNRLIDFFFSMNVLRMKLNP